MEVKKPRGKLKYPDIQIKVRARGVNRGFMRLFEYMVHT